MSIITLFTYGSGTYEELMKNYYNLMKLIRLNLLIDLIIFIKELSGFDEIDLE
ncbi:1726_t:CDS:1, partial [Funneliformis caledonium]